MISPVFGANIQMAPVQTQSEPTFFSEPWHVRVHVSVSISVHGGAGGCCSTARLATSS